MWTKVALVSILVTSCVAFEEKDSICTSDFCTKYIEDKGCPKLSESCLAQNSTHNGVYLPYPDLCNCCDYCITNLALNEICILGSPGMPPPEAICGPGLACTANKPNPPTCQPMKTKCTNKQSDWDERRADGTLGMTEVRPKCDDDGIFLPVHCIPGSVCYCISTEGDRIFGEIPFLNRQDEYKMTCECSLNHWKALQSVNPEFKDVTLTARCNAYGLYDPLQCMTGNEANCFCVNPITGEPKIDVAPVPVSELKTDNPSCFDSSIHVSGTYETECEIMKRKWHEETSSTTTIPSVRTSDFENPSCQPDGKFYRVQILGEKQICVDPSGQRIDNFEASVDSTGKITINCNCARTLWLLRNAGVVELPSCCSDGSFKACQSRRNDFFCVDTNGDQMGVEKNINDIDQLSCCDVNKLCA